MSDGGGGFEVHPGDPWHPGWTDDAVDDPAPASTAPEKAAKPPRKRWFARRDRGEVPAGGDESTREEDHAYSEPLADPQARFRPATPFVPEPPTTDPADGTAGEPPPLELPAWVGDATLGAEVEAAGFDSAAQPVASQGEAAAAAPQPVEPEIEPVSAPLPVVEPALPMEPAPPVSPPPLEVEATEVGAPAAGEAPTEELSDPFEELRLLEAATASGATEEAAVTPQPEAATTVYGVAGKEAFSVLGEEDEDEDLADWTAFAGEPGGSARRAPAAPTTPEPSAAPTEEPEPGTRERRGGVWPFRRRRHQGEPEVADEVPVVEDVWPEEEVLGPGGWAAPDGRYLAEPEASPDEFAAEPEPGPPLAPAPAGAGDEAEWDEPTAPAPVPLGLGETDDDPAAAFAPPLGRVDPPEAAEPDWGEEEPVLDPEQELQLGFDDGTAEETFVPSYEPRPAASRRDEVWGADPDWDPEATVEMTDPGLGRHEDVYGMAGTMEHRGLAEEMFRLGDEDTEWQAMTAAMPGVESGVVGFEDVADLSTGEEYEEGPRSDLGARVGVGLLLTVFLVGTMFVGGAAMAVFIGAMALLGTWEFYGTLRRLEFQPLAILGYLGGLGILVSVWFHGPIAVPIGLALLVVLVFFVYAFSPMRQDALANGGLTVLAVAWVAGSVAFATPMLRQSDFRMLVLALVVATVAMDIGAFAFGRSFGSRALAPVVSPNKSVEGLVGGVLVTMAAGVGFGLLVEPFDLTTGIALGAVVAVLAPLGDLAESMVKRSLGVKDMGTLLPGHGGVLDRIDGFLFVLPAVWVLYRITGLLG